MKESIRSSILCLLAALLYAYLFYHGAVGANVFVFDAVLLLLLLRIRPELGKRTAFRWTLAPLLVSAIAVVVVHSPASFLAHAVSFTVLLGYAQARELRFVWYALALGVMSLIAAPWRQWAERPERWLRLSPGVKNWVRQTAVPALLLLPFLFLYSTASAEFSASLGWFAGKLLALGRSERLLRVLGLLTVGTLLTLPLFFPTPANRVAGWEGKLRETLTRGSGRRKPKGRLFGAFALRQEYRRGVLTLAVLNALLFFLNLTDLRHIWAAGGRQDAATLSKYVHSGTYSLVISIVIAMGLVLYYFRGNLNFYTEARHLKPLTYLWLGQNALLALSVGVRNWHYVSAHGLAFGRIYIVFVLALMLVGLFTLYRKVSGALTFSYLLQANGLAAWLFLVGFGAVNWVGVITRVNLTQEPLRIDWPYLIVELGNENTFLLRERVDRIPAGYLDRSGWRRALDAGQYEPRDWREWNWPDHRNRHAY